MRGILRNERVRTGSENKDSDKRQRAAVEACAAANGYEVVQTYYDAAVSGTDPIDQHAGMMDLLDAVLSNGTRTILVESPDRFARDAVVQELGHCMLTARGVDLTPTTAPDNFMADTPTTELVQTILGAVNAFDRRQTVEKLKTARDRKSAALGRRIEGRKPVADATLQEAKRLYRRSPKTSKRRGLRQIAAEMAKLGHHAPNGNAYHANSNRQMLEREGVYQH